MTAVRGWQALEQSLGSESRSGRGTESAWQRHILAAAPAYRTRVQVPEYSNTNYMIAGAALERVAKMPWERLIREELFKAA